MSFDIDLVRERIINSTSEAASFFKLRAAASVRQTTSQIAKAWTIVHG